MSTKNIDKILDRINAEHVARPVPKPSTTECTGCGVEFAEDDLDEDDDDEEKTYAEEVCDDCGAFHCLITDIWAGNASSIRLYGL
jgi:NAD-dependent SIR2 family protein deacetylase